jgi:hypothetical protein
VCATQGAVRSAQLACLDAVMARIDMLARDLATATASRSDGTGAILIEPALCTSEHPPQLRATIDPELAAAFAALRRAGDGQKIDPPRTTDACANLAATLAQMSDFADAHDATAAQLGAAFEALRQLERDYTRCSDDALRALAAFALVTEPVPGALERAEEAVRAFPSERMRGRLAMTRGDYATAAGEVDEAERLFAAALEHFTNRNLPSEQVEATLAQLRILLERGKPADLRAAVALADRWRPKARALASTVAITMLERWAAHARWRLGDVAGADAVLQSVGDEAGMTHRLGNREARDLSGVVVDETGAPVAGAQIAAGQRLVADSALVSSPLYGDERIVISDAAGRFTLPDVIGKATAVHAGRRGTGTSRIVLHPTTTLVGHVALADLATGRIHVLVRRGDYYGVAPVKEDGSYTLANVPRGALEVEVLPISVRNRIAPTRVIASGDRTTVDLVARRFQRIYVIARTTDTRAPEFAPVWVLHKPEPTLRRTTFGKFQRIADAVMLTASIRARPPTAIASQAHADDLIAELADRPPGPITICATAFNREHVYAMATRPAMVDELAVACTTIDATATVALVELPPLRRVE